MTDKEPKIINLTYYGYKLGDTGIRLRMYEAQQDAKFMTEVTGLDAHLDLDAKSACVYGVNSLPNDWLTRIREQEEAWAAAIWDSISQPWPTKRQACIIEKYTRACGGQVCYTPRYKPPT